MMVSDTFDFPILNSTNFANIIYHPKRIHYDDIMKIFSIFDPIVWKMIIIFMILIITINVIINPKFVMNIIFDYYQVIFKQCIIVKIYHNRTLVASWFISLFFIVFIFLNDILSIILTEKFIMFESTEDMKEADVRIMMPPSYLQDFFIKVIKIKLASYLKF